MPFHGTVTAAGIDEVHTTGLEGAALHDIVAIEGSSGETPALVIALERDRVVLAPLASASIRPGMTARLRARARVHVTPSLLGRVLTGLDLLSRTGQPGAAHGGDPGEPCGLFPPPGRPRWTAPRKRQAFTTGLLVHDMKGGLRRGDAILLSGEELNGASSAGSLSLQVAGHVLRHQESTGGVCVFARLSPGPDTCSSRDLLTAAHHARDSNAHSDPWARTLFLEAGEAATPAMSWLVGRAAVAVARLLADQGADVTLAVDGFPSLRGPAFDRLPGWSPFAELGLLTSAAGPHAGGSLTVLFTDRGHLPREAHQLFDTHLDLRRTFTGQIPVRYSTFARPPVRPEPMSALGRILLASQEAELHSGASWDTATARRGRRIHEALRFHVAASLDLVEQLLCVLAADRLDSLAPSDVARFIERYIRTLREQHAPYLQRLRDTAIVPDTDQETWARAATAVAGSLKP